MSVEAPEPDPDPQPHWAWAGRGGKHTAFDADAARDAATWDDPNPKKSSFFSGPKDVPSWPSARKVKK